jgi:hypothetical protein
MLNKSGKLTSILMTLVLLLLLVLGSVAAEPQASPAEAWAALPMSVPIGDGSSSGG